MATYIVYDDEKYYMNRWRYQCFKCDSILETWNCNCKCGLIIIKNGQRTWPYIPVHDVSIWKTQTGKFLPQRILDDYFLSRKSNHTSTDTETSTSTSRGTNTWGINVQDGERGKSS